MARKSIFDDNPINAFSRISLGIIGLLYLGIILSAFTEKHPFSHWIALIVLNILAYHAAEAILRGELIPFLQNSPTGIFVLTIGLLAITVYLELEILCGSVVLFCFPFCGYWLMLDPTDDRTD